VRKKEIRIHFLEERKAISPAKHTQWSQQIAASVKEKQFRQQSIRNGVNRLLPAFLRV